MQLWCACVLHVRVDEVVEMVCFLFDKVVKRLDANTIHTSVCSFILVIEKS